MTRNVSENRDYPKPPRGSPRWQRQQQQKHMQDLRELDGACQQMIEQVGRISPYLRNKELIESGAKGEIANQSTILSRDLGHFQKDLAIIRAAWPSKDIDPEDPEDLALSLDLGHRYQEWQERFQQTILPTFDRLCRLLQEAGVNFEDNEQESA